MRTTVDHAMERLAQARPIGPSSTEDVLSPSEEDDLLAWILSDDAVALSMSTKTPHHRRAAVLVIASVAAVAVALVVYACVPNQAAPGKRGAVASAGQWRLAGYFQPDWQQSISAPHAGALTCPTTNVCYLTAAVPVSNPIGHGPNPATELFVSTDHGATWTEIASKGATSFGALVCPTGDANDCLSGGMQGNRPVLLVTTDGGSTWIGRPLPSGAGQIVRLSCTSLTHCVGTFSTSANPYSSDGVAYVTHNGGASWTLSDTGGVLLQSFTCTGTTCVGFGDTPGPTPSSPATEVNLYSHDSGSTWSEAAVPAGENFGFLGAPACPDTTHCFGIGGIGPSGQPGEQAVVESSNGGASWQFVPSLTGVQAFAFAIACPSDLDCYIVGGGRQSGTGSSITETGPGKPVDGMITVPNVYAPWVYSTTDGGSTWSKITLAVPKEVPVGTELTSLEDIGQISCPSVTACVAVGAGEEVGDHTATYTNAPSGQNG